MRESSRWREKGGSYQTCVRLVLEWLCIPPYPHGYHRFLTTLDAREDCVPFYRKIICFFLHLCICVAKLENSNRTLSSSPPIVDVFRNHKGTRIDR
jgi:hypothetical protein